MMVQRGGQFTFSDHGPLNMIGKNTIMIHGWGNDDPNYHTTQDRAENISNETLKLYGQFAERYIVNLDAVGSLSNISQDYILAGNLGYYPTWMFYPAVFFFFLSITFIGCFEYKPIKEKITRKLVLNGIGRYLYWMIPFLILCGVMFLFTLIGILPPIDAYNAVNLMMKMEEYYWALYFGFLSAILTGILLYQLKKNSTDNVIDEEVQANISMIMIRGSIIVGYILLLTQNFFAATILTLIAFMQLIILHQTPQSIEKSSNKRMQNWKYHLGLIWALFPVLLLIILMIVFYAINLRFGWNIFWMIFVIGLYHFPVSALIGVIILLLYNPLMIFFTLTQKHKK
jgi:hypothetical protein